MKILFTYFPLYVLWNHGVALLTAICKEHGIDADYFPCGTEAFIEKMKDYDTVGFSFVTDLDYQASLPSMKSAINAGKTVLAGGVYARRMGKIETRLVHHICRGEGEIIPDFILNGKEDIFDHKYYQVSLDGLPMPDLSHVTGFEFHRGMPFLQKLRIIPYQTSRGCPYKCSFCEVQYQPNTLRIKHTIHDDLTMLSEQYNPDLFYIMDSQPPYYSEEWREQWEYLNVPFQCFIRADIESTQLEWMIDHGLKVAAFGIESGDEKFRNEVLHKNITDDDILRTVKILKKRNVIYIPFYIANIPGESLEDRIKTVEMMKDIGGWPTVWLYQSLEATRVQMEA
jgi:radical SAM superfamily enzyme YgiQ (UPF0313 family)